MAYATRDYYISGYLQGRSPAVPDADFLFWEKQAERIVDSYTFDRIKANDSLLTDDVKDCTCELTELLYRADKASQSTSDFGGPLTSYSNDGESGTIDLSRSIYTEEGKRKVPGDHLPVSGKYATALSGGVRMNPNYNQIITVFRKVGTAWSKSVFEQCFWKSGITVVQNDTEASQTNTYTVRIPLEAAGSDFSASPGDVVVLGECADEITGKSPNTAAEVLRRNKPAAFLVSAYSDNTAYRMAKHYRLGG